MSDEELLRQAEAKLKAASNSEDFLIEQSMAIASIAASLLVIARNSVVKEEDVVDPMPQQAPDWEEYLNAHSERYAGYWNEELQKYMITDEWKPTKNQMEQYLRKHYEFEYPNKA